MILLDAYPLVAILAEEPAAHEVADLLRAQPAAITAVNLAEAIDVSCRVGGADEREVVGLIETLETSGVLTVVPIDEGAARTAARLRIEWYARGVRALSLADCFLLAVSEGDAIVTADPAVAEVARAQGITVLAVPDSLGRLP